jgi:hypothetical protein
MLIHNRQSAFLFLKILGKERGDIRRHQAEGIASAKSRGVKLDPTVKKSTF